MKSVQKIIGNQRLEPEQVYALLSREDNKKTSNKLSFVIPQAESPDQLLVFFNLLNMLKESSDLFVRFRHAVPDDKKRQEIIASPNRGALSKLVAATDQVVPENFYDDVEQIINIIVKLQTFYPGLGDNTLKSVNEVIEKLQGNDPIISIAVCVGNCSKESGYADGPLHWVGFTLHGDNLYFSDSFSTTFEKLITPTEFKVGSYLDSSNKFIVQEPLDALKCNLEVLTDEDADEAKKIQVLSEYSVSTLRRELVPKLNSYLCIHENKALSDLLQNVITPYLEEPTVDVLTKIISVYQGLLDKDEGALRKNLTMFLRDEKLINDGLFPIAGLDNNGFTSKLKEELVNSMHAYTQSAEIHVHNMKGQQQTDGFSCGYHTVMNLRSHLDAIVSDKSFSDFSWHSASHTRSLVAQMKAEINNEDSTYTTLSSLEKSAKLDDEESYDNNLFMLVIVAIYAFIIGDVLAASGIFVLVFIVGLLLAYVVLNQDVFFHSEVSVASDQGVVTVLKDKPLSNDSQKGYSLVAGNGTKPINSKPINSKQINSKVIDCVFPKGYKISHTRHVNRMPIIPEGPKIP